MEEIIISVIIPVYNSDIFLKRCLESIISQTLASLEIICIDDCSTDNSFNILTEYSKKDNRIKVFKNSKNIGQGLTRNRGIDLAKGEYIAFVDSDDWIESDMYESLYGQTINKKYDLVCCNLIYDFPNGDSEVIRMPSSEKITQNFMIKESISPTIKLFSPNSPCDKIYKREYIEKLNLRFKSERVLLYEDKLFNLTFFSSNPSFCFLTKSLYHYVVRYGSTMTSYRLNFKERYFEMDEKIKNLLLQNNLLTDELKQRFSKSLFEITFAFCLNALVYNKSIKGKIVEFLNIVNDSRISTNVKFFSLQDIPPSTSSINGFVKSFCFLTLKYLRK